MFHHAKLFRSFIFASTLALASSLVAQDAKIGFIEWRPSELPTLINGLIPHFPVNTFEHVTLTNNIGDHGLDAVLNEMESYVVDMKSRGINKIMIGASSAETGPFIEGAGGTLAGIHSDLRHPDVIFSADRQGTASVDNALNWYRPGIDFVTGNELGAPVLLPDVFGVTPKPQFILASDFSPAVDQTNTPFTARAVAAGYEVVNVDLGWNETTTTFDNFAPLGTAIVAAPANSRVGLSASAAPSADDSLQYARWVRLSELGTADPNVFDPANGNVEYVGMNYNPFFGDFDNPGSIAVDVEFGVSFASPLLSDPSGVNPILVELGYPENEQDAYSYENATYGGSGIVTAAAFAWLATDGKSNLDSRHLIDENRQLVEYYIQDVFQPAGATWDEPVFSEVRVNPRWTARAVPEPSSLALCGLAALTLLGLRCRNAATLSA
jgi:hypothetical protein